MEPPAVIDWSKPAVEIHNLIRAFATPFPGVHTCWNEQKLVVKRSAPVKDREVRRALQAPGTVERIDPDGIEIATGDGGLFVTQIGIEGQVMANAKLADIGLKAGDKLGNA